MSSPHRVAAFLIALVALPAAAAAQAEAPPPEAPPPKKLSVGTEGFFNPSLLLQGWFTYDHADETTTSFRLRRAEVHVKGEILPKQIAYEIHFDPARALEFTNTELTDSGGDTVTVRQPQGNATIMQDFFITYLTDYADVSIGQFKIPVSWEGYNSSAKIVLPERAFVSTVFGDKRDVGIRIEKTFEKFGYSAGFYNGAGQDNFDNNNQKDVALRLEVYPIKGMTIAAVTYDSLGYRKRAGTKDRWEGDFRYESGPFLIQAEYIRAVDVTKTGATSCANAAGKCTGHGAYGALGYKVKGLGAGSWKGDFQPVVRIGFFDPDVDNDVTAMTPAENGRVDYEIGANYYLRNHEAKLQLSYDRQQFEDTDIKPAVNEIILAAQVWY